MSWIRIAGLAFGICAAAHAADQSGWEKLEALCPGDKLRVELRGKPDVTGAFGAVLPDRLQLVRRKETTDIPRTEIRRAYLKRKRSAGRAAAPWIGTAAGFGTGFAVGYRMGDSTPDRQSSAGCTGFCVAFGSLGGFGPHISKPAAGAVLGVAGAGIGAIAGHYAGGASETLVYQAR